VANRGKKYLKARELKDKPEFSLEEAVTRLKQGHYVKFDESVDLSLRLGVNPKQSDQMVRGTVVLPHGTGKTRRSASWPAARRSKRPRRPGPTSPAARS
jgi:large subunit ribosomal protein L1